MGIVAESIIYIELRGRIVANGEGIVQTDYRRVSLQARGEILLLIARTILNQAHAKYSKLLLCSSGICIIPAIILFYYIIPTFFPFDNDAE